MPKPILRLTALLLVLALVADPVTAAAFTTNSLSPAREQVGESGLPFESEALTLMLAAGLFMGTAALHKPQPFATTTFPLAQSIILGSKRKRTRRNPEQASERWKIDSSVLHKKYGLGTILQSGQKIKAHFPGRPDAVFERNELLPVLRIGQLSARISRTRSLLPDLYAAIENGTLKPYAAPNPRKNISDYVFLREDVERVSEAFSPPTSDVPWLSAQQASRILKRDAHLLAKYLDRNKKAYTQQDVEIKTYASGVRRIRLNPEYVEALKTTLPEVKPANHATARELAVFLGLTDMQYHALLTFISRGDTDVRPDRYGTKEAPFHLYKLVKGKFKPSLLKAVRKKFRLDLEGYLPLHQAARFFGISQTRLGRAVWAFLRARIRRVAKEFGISEASLVDADSKHEGTPYNILVRPDALRDMGDSHKLYIYFKESRRASLRKQFKSVLPGNTISRTQLARQWHLRSTDLNDVPSDFQIPRGSLTSHYYTQRKSFATRDRKKIWDWIRSHRTAGPGKGTPRLAGAAMAAAISLTALTQPELFSGSDFWQEVFIQLTVLGIHVLKFFLVPAAVTVVLGGLAYAIKTLWVRNPPGSRTQSEVWTFREALRWLGGVLGFLVLAGATVYAAAQGPVTAPVDPAANMPLLIRVLPNLMGLGTAGVIMGVIRWVQYQLESSLPRWVVPVVLPKLRKQWQKWRQEGALAGFGLGYGLGELVKNVHSHVFPISMLWDLAMMVLGGILLRGVYRDLHASLVINIDLSSTKRMMLAGLAPSVFSLNNIAGLSAAQVFDIPGLEEPTVGKRLALLGFGSGYRFDLLDPRLAPGGRWWFVADAQAVHSGWFWGSHVGWSQDIFKFDGKGQLLGMVRLYEGEALQAIKRGDWRLNRYSAQLSPDQLKLIVPEHTITNDMTLGIGRGDYYLKDAGRVEGAPEYHHLHIKTEADAFDHESQPAPAQPQPVPVDKSLLRAA